MRLKGKSTPPKFETVQDFVDYVTKFLSAQTSEVGVHNEIFHTLNGRGYKLTDGHALRVEVLGYHIENDGTFDIRYSVTLRKARQHVGSETYELRVKPAAEYVAELEELVDGMTPADFLLPDQDDPSDNLVDFYCADQEEPEYDEEKEAEEERYLQHLRERDAANDAPDDEVSPELREALEAALGAPAISLESSDDDWPEHECESGIPHRYCEPLTDSIPHLDDPTP